MVELYCPLLYQLKKVDSCLHDRFTLHCSLSQFASVRHSAHTKTHNGSLTLSLYMRATLASCPRTSAACRCSVVQIIRSLLLAACRVHGTTLPWVQLITPVLLTSSSVLLQIIFQPLMLLPWQQRKVQRIHRKSDTPVLPGTYNYKQPIAPFPCETSNCGGKCLQYHLARISEMILEQSPFRLDVFSSQAGTKSDLCREVSGSHILLALLRDGSAPQPSPVPLLGQR